jgi:hypothetical protein
VKINLKQGSSLAAEKSIHIKWKGKGNLCILLHLIEVIQMKLHINETFLNLLQITAWNNYQQLQCAFRIKWWILFLSRVISEPGVELCVYTQCSCMNCRSVTLKIITSSEKDIVILVVCWVYIVHRCIIMRIGTKTHYEYADHLCTSDYISSVT